MGKGALDGVASSSGIFADAVTVRGLDFLIICGDLRKRQLVVGWVIAAKDFFS